MTDMRVKNDDVVFHKHFAALYIVVNFVSQTDFYLSPYPRGSDGVTFNSGVAYIEKVYTKEKNPEYYL